jgi:hypothetical protein
MYLSIPSFVLVHAAVTSNKSQKTEQMFQIFIRLVSRAIQGICYNGWWCLA